MSEGPLAVGFDEVSRGPAGRWMSVGLGAANRDRPVWYYWFPLLCSLFPGRLEAFSVEALSARPARPFVYPIELRSETVEWCAREGRDESLAALPAPVARAVAGRRAIVVLYIAHEGRTLHDPDAPQDVLDKVGQFAEYYRIPPEQLWLISGNLDVLQEVSAWRRRRGLVTVPFTVRGCEPFSAFVGGCAREALLAGRGPSIDVTFVRSGPHRIGWRTTRVGWVRRRFPYPPEASAGSEPASLRFACLNRMFRAHRWAVLTRLWRAGLLPYGLVSFPAPTKDDWDTEGIAPDLDEYRELLAELPLVADRPFRTDDDRSFFAENQRAIGLHPPRVARDCAMEIVNETYQRSARFVSEKIFKALIGRGPAVVVGTRAVLSYLHDIGVETWPDLLDEDYDGIDDPDLRLEAAVGSALDLVRDRGRLDRADALNDERRTRNLRWLTDAPKPWDALCRELAASLREL